MSRATLPPPWRHAFSMASFVDVQKPALPYLNMNAEFPTMRRIDFSMLSLNL
jgi:hypothetical protein